MFKKKLLAASIGGSFYPYSVGAAVTFNSADSGTLYRTQVAPTDQDVWTCSFFVQRHLLQNGDLFSAYSDSNNYTRWRWDSNFLDQTVRVAGANVGDQNNSSRLARDTTGYAHVCISRNGSGASAITVEINGVEDTEWTGTAYGAGEVFMNGNGYNFTINGYNSSGNPGDNSYAEFAFVDGTVYSASDFVELKEEIIVARNLSHIAWGDNGSYQKFSDPDDMGKDFSGNGNHFTESASGVRQTLSTPTNRFATWDNLAGVRFDNTGTATAEISTFSNGNLNVVAPASPGDGDSMHKITNMAIPDVPTYAEFTNINTNSGVSVNGAFKLDNPGSGGGGDTYYGRIYYNANGSVAITQGATGSSSGSPASYTSSDIISVRVDKVAGTIKFYKNGSLQSTVSSVTFPRDGWFFGLSLNSSASGLSINANFGQLGFTYALPAGHYPLCTESIPEPLIGPNSAIKPSDVFVTRKWTGNGIAYGSGGNAINCGVDMTSGAWVVFLHRLSASQSWECYDTIRGATKRIYPDSSNAGDTSSEGLAEFTSTGFTLGSSAGCNASGASYVAYCFKATAGFFDIQTYTGTGSNTTVSHNLGVVPDWITCKKYGGDTRNWRTYVSSLPVSDPETDYLNLDETAEVADYNLSWNDTAPTSSVFSVGSDQATNQSSGTHVAYLWANVPGFCKVGYRRGNGNVDGAFENLGFLPMLHISKETSGVGSFYTFDSVRDPDNPVSHLIQLNEPNAESSASDKCDFVSNGVKVRTTDGDMNGSGLDFITLSIGITEKYSNAR